MTTPHTKRRRVGIVAFITAVLTLLGGTATWAYWTATASGTGTVTTRTVTVSQSGFNAMSAVFQNHALTATASFTVSNTGQTDGQASIAIVASGTLAANLPLRAWPVSNPAACTAATTMPSNAASGTWANFALSTPVPLTAGASVTYCVRTTAVSRQSIAHANGTQSASPQLTVTFDDVDGWQGVRTLTPTTSHSTELIYPYPPVDSVNYVQTNRSNWFVIGRNASSGLCLDVSGNGGAGTRSITWDCHNNPNQRWEIVPVGSAEPSLVRIRPKHGPGLGTRLSASTSHAVTIANYDANATTQLWEFQRISNTTFQLVAHGSGRCLAMHGASEDVQLVTEPCSTATAGRNNQVLRLTREPLTATNGTNVVFSFGTTTGSDSYRLQRWTGSAWTDQGSASGTGATSVQIARTSIPNNATSQWRIVINGTSTVVYDNITLTRSGTTVSSSSGLN